MTNPLPGDFACIPVSGQVGELIRIGQWLNGDGFHDYEHAELFVGMANERAPLGYTMSAYPGGAHLVAVPENQEGWLWSTGAITPSDAQRDKIVAAAMACQGIPYSALDYFALAAHRLHVPDVDDQLKNYIGAALSDRPRSLICSQLVDRAEALGGVHLFNDNRWPGFVPPAALAQVIMHPEHVTYD